ncbi:Phosphate transporter [Pseudomonas syringae pv. delphinii]|nr:Phosphate transporter [Pseudomonas syringae pv. delphinii]RMP16685.1 Phosphate transporter [Pseudomonas syringae pv. delphinii]
MAINALSPDATGRASLSATQFGRKPGRLTMVIFFAILIAGLLFTGYSLKQDVDDMGTVVTTWTPFVLLGVALLIALAFEFVNGFHDTANAVATVIYTHSLPPGFAVVWSGFFNFLGVMLSSGAVAFGIIALLPVELILQTGSSAGFAMIFALLIAAIIWNLGTWWLGLPASSSHTLIGSIIGVGIANALMHGRDGTSGVDWSQATKIGYSLLLSPLVGFGCAALLLLAMRMFIKNRALYKAPEGNAPPPLWIRAMLIVTCTGVSFAHGSNDGQKGMGLIMLILVGTLPMAYALNRTMPADQATQFAAVAEVTQQALIRSVPQPAPSDSRQTLSDYLVSKQAGPDLIPALAVMTGKIGNQVASYGSLSKVPAEAVTNVRNDMYLTSETIRLMDKNKVGNFDADTQTKLDAFYSDLGQDCRGHRLRAGHDGRLEAYRRDRRRADRQDAHDLRPRGVGRGGGDVHHRRGGHVRAAGVDYPCVVVRRGRFDGRQRLGATNAHPAQPGHRLGIDPAGGHFAVGFAVLAVQ